MLLSRAAQDADRLWDEARSSDVESLRAEGVHHRDAALHRLRSGLGPPRCFRLIHCKPTCLRRRVILVDGHHHLHGFTCISHTWGYPVYAVFDCPCASECAAAVPPRSSCLAIHMEEEHPKIVADILTMCDRMWKDGSEYVWHDGVCIAQHDQEEVADTIAHMGWIYATASHTTIFLDYVGNPIALLQPAADRGRSRSDPFQARWPTRVWTLQESMLSKRRRYCIRIVPPSVPKDFEDFQHKLIRCYEDDTSIAVIDEDAFWEQLLLLFDDVRVVLKQIAAVAPAMTIADPFSRPLLEYLVSLISWVKFMRRFIFAFPSLGEVLKECAMVRQSKHEGDRINSVLGLAGITDFVAPKDGNLEGSTIEFLKRLGQEGLRDALFWVNNEYEGVTIWDRILPSFMRNWVPSSWSRSPSYQHTWVFCLSKTFFSPEAHLRKAKTSKLNSDKLTWDLCSCDPMKYQELVLIRLMELLSSPKAWPFSWPLFHHHGLSTLGQPASSSIAGDDQLVTFEVLQNGMLELRGTLMCIPVVFNVIGDLRLSPKLSFINDSLVLDLVPFDDLPSQYTVVSHDVYSITCGGACIPSALGVPAVQGQIIRQGNSFLSHLVLAQFYESQEIQCCFPLPIVVGDIPNDENFEPQVCRLGFLLATGNMIRLIKFKGCFTMLNRLVIK